MTKKKKLKLAITQRAVIKNLNKLKKFGLNKANSIIEDSIDSGWKDLYLKESLIVKTDKEQDGIANMLGFGDSNNMPFKVIIP